LICLLSARAWIQSRSLQSTRFSALLIRLFTGIFVLQLLEQRHLSECRPIAKSSQLYLEIRVLPWDRYEALVRMSAEIMNRLVNSIDDDEVFLRFIRSNNEVPIYTSYRQAIAGGGTSKGQNCRF